MSGVQFEIRVITNDGAAQVREVKTELNEAAASANNAGSSFKKIGDAVFTFNNISQAIGNAVGELNRAVQPGIDFNSSLKDMQAITGVSDALLNELGATARQNAKDFGVDASNAVEGYKLLLSQLGPELASTPQALSAMNREAATLSKQLSGDLAGATGILTTAMNQYGISIKDPIAATKVMAEMSNIMSAAAKEGSAELPQIKSALEQAGMMAKTANVSFAETNAAIQLLDKSGKKGAEGGVALRNVLANLSEGQFMNRQSLDMLKAAGVDVNALGDKSKTLTERLQTLAPIANNTAAMTQLFGKENVAAGIALVNNTGEIEKLTQKITGTSTSTEMANTVMGSFKEKMARVNAELKDVGISIFNATEGFLPFVQIGMGALQTMSNLAGAVQAFGIISNTSMVKSIVAGITSMGTWIATTITATAAQWGLNIAMNANPIGIVVVAIGIAIGAIALLIKYWDDIKHAIGVFAEWIYDHSPFKFLTDLVEKIFPGFKAKMGELWDWVKAKFDALFGWIGKLWDNIKSFFGAGDTKDVNVSGTVEVAGTAGVSTPGMPTGNNQSLSTTHKNSSNKTINETASRITSGGSKSNTIIIHKLQDQTVIHTTNLEMGGKQAGNKIVDMILEALASLDNNIQPA